MSSSVSDDDEAGATSSSKPFLFSLRDETLLPSTGGSALVSLQAKASVPMLFRA